MPDYKEMYLKMVRESEKAITLTEQAFKTLIAAQRDCEEMYINSPDPIIQLLITGAEPQQTERRHNMIYTDEEKRRMDNVLKAFADFIEDQNYFDISYSSKLGYFMVPVVCYSDNPITVFKTAEELVKAITYELSNEVVYTPGHKRPDPDAPRLYEDEEAETRCRLAGIFGTMEEEERDYWLAYTDQYLKDYQETGKYD